MQTKQDRHSEDRGTVMKTVRVEEHCGTATEYLNMIDRNGTLIRSDDFNF